MDLFGMILLDLIHRVCPLETLILEAPRRRTEPAAGRGGAGHAVGYTSASQFTREYRRLFGSPPGQDAARLKDSRVVVE